MRQLAVASAVLMVVIALGAATQLWFVIVGFALGAVVTVADNGLAYTSVAEIAGRRMVRAGHSACRTPCRTSPPWRPRRRSRR